LWAARPDLLAIETIPSAVEAEALADVLEEIGDAPAWVSFTCADGEHLADGSSFDEVVAIADAAPQVVAIGVNCTAPPYVPGLVRRAAAATAKPIVAYPNRGGIWDATTKSWTGDDVPEGFGSLAAKLRTAGARAIGGCCGTGPSDIGAIAELLQTPDPKG
jgi:homocysteine S-methyltransferase